MKHFRLLFVALLMVFLVYAGYRSALYYNDLGFNYVQVACSIFRTDSKIVFIKAAEIETCAFSNDGYVFTVNGELFDSQDQLVWKTSDTVHHQPSFSRDGKAIFYFRVDETVFEGEPVKSDCLVKRDLQGQLLSEWCVKDHLAELKRMGIALSITPMTLWPQNYKHHYSEISHANSVSEIHDVAGNRQRPEFADGNLLFNIYGAAGALVILNAEMKNILWAGSLDRMEHIANDEGFVALHDPQLTPDGKILGYFTSQRPDGTMRSHVVEWDAFAPPPSKFKVLWRSKFTKTSSISISGQVTKVRRNLWLSSEVANEKTYVFTFDSNGNEVWQFKFPENGGYQTHWYLGARPLIDESFLRARHLIDN